MLSIRSETPADIEAIHLVNERAFDRSAEADLVDALRERARPFISLVAEKEGEIVGHILFTPVEVRSDDDSFRALGLAPMAVRPEHQHGGIGSELVRAGLDECRRLGHEIIFVLGHPDYYPRFGFASTKSAGIDCEYPVPEEVFMVIELKPNALRGRTGRVYYHPAFQAAA